MKWKGCFRITWKNIKNKYWWSYTAKKWDIWNRTKALEDKRGLSEEEINLIKEKRDRIAQIELQSIGKTQEEILYAQNEFQNRLRSISLEDASKLVEEKAKIRDDEYVKIKSSYDTKIAMLQNNLSQANDIERTAIQTNRFINSWKRSKT